MRDTHPLSLKRALIVTLITPIILPFLLMLLVYCSGLLWQWFGLEYDRGIHESVTTPLFITLGAWIAYLIIPPIVALWFSARLIWHQPTLENFMRACLLPIALSLEIMLISTMLLIIGISKGATIAFIAYTIAYILIVLALHLIINGAILQRRKHKKI
jgi:hypothetical protein